MTSGSTDFAVNLKIMADGTASGEFICAVANAIVLAIAPTTASFKADGSVVITGIEYGFDVAGFMSTGTVVLRADGVGVGGFDYRDQSGFFGPGQYDTEVVRVGSIKVTR